MYIVSEKHRFTQLMVDCLKNHGFFLISYGYDNKAMMSQLRFKHKNPEFEEVVALYVKHQLPVPPAPEKTEPPTDDTKGSQPRIVQKIRPSL